MAKDTTADSFAVVVTSISDLWSSQHPVNKHFFHLAGVILYVNPVDDFPQLNRALRSRILIDDKAVSYTHLRAHET